MTTLHRRLNPANLRFVQSMRGTISTDDYSEEIIARIGKESIKRGIMKQLRVAVPIKKDLMQIVCALFTDRNFRIALAHRDVNSSTTNYEEYKQSLFCSSCILQLGDNPLQADLDKFLSDGLRWNNLHRLYICIPPSVDGSDAWRLLILDLVDNVLYYLDPRLDVKQQIPAGTRNAMIEYSALVAPLARALGRDNRIDCVLYPYQLGTHIQNDFDAGVYIIMALYCITYDCPIVLSEADMSKMRDNISYWLLSESLPI